MFTLCDAFGGCDHLWVGVDAEGAVASFSGEASDQPRSAADIEPGFAVASGQHVNGFVVQGAVKIRALQPSEEQRSDHACAAFGRHSVSRMMKSVALNMGKMEWGRDTTPVAV